MSESPSETQGSPTQSTTGGPSDTATAPTAPTAPPTAPTTPTSTAGTAGTTTSEDTRNKIRQAAVALNAVLLAVIVCAFLYGRLRGKGAVLGPPIPFYEKPENVALAAAIVLVGALLWWKRKKVAKVVMFWK